MRWESTQRHMGVRGDLEPANAINTYRPCTKGYQKTTKLATGARSGLGLIRGPSGLSKMDVRPDVPERASMASPDLFGGRMTCASYISMNPDKRSLAAIRLSYNTLLSFSESLLSVLSVLLTIPSLQWNNS
ncbi:uncharacterized protein BDR25DRAFT_354754 [Lindgomyces ingoldianus]|uniref:Uncharacterized protein n=1 Tax=Lindgomyces ingoldianus TaxID=673940 RepID=A0ACB6QUZ7_9PLEO|nr:uncharacterized protein BDR25DRAFT_354754 [Lindgomyces ingoldianus]KAF2470844.1 hypothetical protein BDR25DRAFT_354754 [Lindgomyces ingoldianus]